jgi:hypothetical protein
VQLSTGVRPESQSIMRPPLRWFSRDKGPRAYLLAESAVRQAGNFIDFRLGGLANDFAIHVKLRFVGASQD